MANDKHVALLKQGVAAWNAWRDENPDIRPDLSGADLRAAYLRRANLIGADLRGADLDGPQYETGVDLSEANLTRADLRRASLSGADLTGANLRRANLVYAYLGDANLRRANLIGAWLNEANLRGADLREADLSEAHLTRATLSRANLSGANLSEAGLEGVDLIDANLSAADLTGADLALATLVDTDLTGADLTGANLAIATLVDTDLTGADLTGCRIHGVSAWGLKLDGTKQHNLVITRRDEPAITVDDIEVAQFIYLLLHNQKVRDVIDTITSKVVLILGRFTDERKKVLDALHEELRKRDYVPILFDFDPSATRDITETITLLARMARFIIADLTDPSSIPKELEAIVPQLAVPVQPLLEGAARPYAMFKDYWKYDWVLPVYRYEGLEPLLAMLAEKVITPAEGKVKALEERRRMIEAELTKPQ
jgi:uncharacterized protein YjbI with pentapeptide repeats